MLLEGDNIQIPIGIYDNFTLCRFFLSLASFTVKPQLSCDYSSSLLKKLGIKTLLVIVVVPKLRSLFSLSLSQPKRL